MSARQSIIAVMLAAALVVSSACTKDVEPRSRAFMMGFASVPYGRSSEVLEYVYDKLAVESDIVNHHFDNGVPWVAALTDAAFPKEMMEDWSFRRDKISTPHKTYVSVSPINQTHDGLAWFGISEGTAPSPWNSYRFTDEAVKNAYLNYCRRVIDFFKPDYFAMSVEGNLLYKAKPDMWSGYLEFHEYIYTELKREYPSLPVFSTIAGAPLLKGFLPDNDHVMQRLAAMQLLEMSDYYAISLYLPVSAYQMTSWPENTFDELLSMSAKPVIIAEAACTAEGLVVRTDNGLTLLDADPVKQKLFVEALLAASDKWKAKFVIWLTLRDSQNPTLSSSVVSPFVWQNAGLYDEQGNPRPALNSWHEWFRKRIEQ